MYPSIRPLSAKKLLLFAFFLSATTGFAQQLLPLKPGMAVATCASFFSPVAGSDFVIGVMDVRNPPANLRGQNWSPPMYHGPRDSWTSRNLGQVFGICLDEAGNIYTTATTCYGSGFAGIPLVGPAGPGGVYKLDGQTGEISTFASLPNSGPALGNICYDRDHDQFFVTNFEDGKLYRLSPTGTVLSAFDFYKPDDGTDGVAPLGERPWGVAVYANRVYYGVWWTDFLIPVQIRNNEVRSVGLDEHGEFLNDDRNEFDIQPIPGLAGASAVSDITFSSTGRMIVAERSMMSESSPLAHHSRVMEYDGVPGGWTYLQEFQIGNFDAGSGGHSNTAGGVDFGYGGYDSTGKESIGCDEAVWATGDALRFPGHNPDGGIDHVYGVARIPASGNTPGNVATTSHYIDLDGNLSQQAKTLIGDVEVLRYTCYPPDTLTYTCELDTAQLHAPRGAAYRWTPAEGLSCTTCPEPLAFPNSTTVYTVEVTDAHGAVTRFTRTVLATPTDIYRTDIGEPEIIEDRRISVPVLIAPDPASMGARRFIATITYPENFLLLENGVPPSLESLLKGTIAEGWTINVLEARSGFLRVECIAPPGFSHLSDSGTILRMEFRQLLADTSMQSPLSVAISFPDNGCVNVVEAADTIDYQICGLNGRLMEFARHKYFLNLAPSVVTDQTHLHFSLAFDSPTLIELFDVAGTRVAVLLDRDLSAGEFYLTWKPTLPSGVYYLRITSGSWSESRRLVIAR